jgi:hypothetical protein
METTAAASVKELRLKHIADGTKDQELKRLLEPVIAIYGDYPGATGSHKDWLVVLKSPKAELQRYVNWMLCDGRPQWQVIAEQNGWGPIKDAAGNGAIEQDILLLRQENAVLRMRMDAVKRETEAPLQAKLEALQAVIAEQDEMLENLSDKKT